ncbi:hypothetical protein EV201_2300 [Ancylomarina subtilis]|uniref:Uncharacterized protein n=1 Tax=Ancylomarina subtilis TaxID=1639035 RepID=A0A4Q7VDZ3_9BACT|nr:hypothetical protein [Ancylomarina subtilis]RZT93148.1 hypothetical protein EV201_2300 [Ancylomarina subtilis]
MKNLLKKSLFTLAIVCLGYSAFAQVDQTVTKGKSQSYKVDDEGLTYTWNVNGGTVSDLTTQTGNTVLIDWSIEGTWDLTVFGTDANNCITETRTFQIEVVGAATANFAGTSGPVVTCSDLNGGLPGGLLDESLFALDLKGGVAPYDVTYEVRDASSAVVQASKTVTGIADGEDITITNDFVNTSGGDEVYTVVITKVITKDGVNVTLGADVTRTITVHSKPTISGTISLN